MADRVLELVEKMYNEFSQKFTEMDGHFEQIDKRFEQVDERFDKMELRIDGLEKKIDDCQTDVNTLHRRFVQVEYNLTNRIGILFDANMTVNQALNRIETKIDVLTEKVENHDLRIEALEDGRAKGKKKSI